MTTNAIKEEIVGARNLSNIIVMIVLLTAGSGFFLAGLSSYLNINLLVISDTSEITFIPQGLALLFYGTGAIGIGIYLMLTIFWNIGSGYNEFSKTDELVRIVKHKKFKVFNKTRLESPL
jgi:hypothetical protein